jgi:hypothetical protein
MLEGVKSQLEPRHIILPVGLNGGDLVKIQVFGPSVRAAIFYQRASPSRVR